MNFLPILELDAIGSRLVARVFGAFIQSRLWASKQRSLIKKDFVMLTLDINHSRRINLYLLHGTLQVSYVLLSLSRAFGVNMFNWTRDCIALIPPQALTDSERSRFLTIISDASSGSSLGSLTDRFAEISEVCRRNKAVQDIVQAALQPHDLTFTVVPLHSWWLDVFYKTSWKPVMEGASVHTILDFFPFIQFEWVAASYCSDLLRR